jgi:hypothetical protein
VSHKPLLAVSFALTLPLLLSGCAAEDAPPPGLEPAAADGTWSCRGLAGSTRNAAGDYYITTFGCSVDSSGGVRSDPADNCAPACLGHLAECRGLSGPACERKLGWFSADADRFGCGARLRLTNPNTGRVAVVIAIDRGPACRVEQSVSHWVLDLSATATQYLYGHVQGAGDHAVVQVEAVDGTTPLGPFVATARPDGATTGGGDPVRPDGVDGSAPGPGPTEAEPR